VFVVFLVSIVLKSRRPVQRDDGEALTMGLFRAGRTLSPGRERLPLVLRKTQSSL
jgi:hypothetical protein